MMVQLLIMSMVIFANSRNFTMVGALTLGINSGAYVSTPLMYCIQRSFRIKA